MNCKGLWGRGLLVSGVVMMVRVSSLVIAWEEHQVQFYPHNDAA